MTRAEHLAWCKQRALEFVDVGDLSNAWVSMLSDLQKHPDLEYHSGIQLGTMLFFGGHLNTTREMRKFIEGFN